MFFPAVVFEIGPKGVQPSESVRCAGKMELSKSGFALLLYRRRRSTFSEKTFSQTRKIVRL